MRNHFFIQISITVYLFLSFNIGIAQIKNESPNFTETLYPSNSTEIKYHNDWTKKNYKTRINQFKKEPLHNGDIVFIGNSITQLGRDWSAKFGIPNISNRGIAGDVTDGVLARLKEITYYKPKAIFLLIGINDLFNLHEKRGIPSTNYVGNNIIKIAKQIHKESKETKIYIQTVLPTSKDYLKENIDKVNTIIKQNEKKGLYSVIDLHTKFADENDVMQKDLSTDGTHLNDKGYEVWVQFLKPLLAKKKNIIEFVYPNGSIKSLIMSYDDGIRDDIKLVKLFNENHITGTFHLNSGYLSTTQPWKQRDGSVIYQQYINKDTLKTLYKNHEIASHTSYHKNLKQLSDTAILEEINSDILNLKNLSGRDISSFAYPFGSANETIAQIISTTGITNARTVKETNAFDLPENYLLWHPTCHHSKAIPLLDTYLSLRNNKLTVFYVWGHSWELRDKNKWDSMVTFCQKAGNRKDMWYVGASDFVSYQKTLQSLNVSDEFIENPKNNKTVYYKENGNLKVLHPGKKINLKAVFK